MTSYYLVNSSGCTFDRAYLDNDDLAARWGAGRGGDYSLYAIDDGPSDRLVASWRNGRRHHTPQEDFRGPRRVSASSENLRTPDKAGRRRNPGKSKQGAGS